MRTYLYNKIIPIGNYKWLHKICKNSTMASGQAPAVN